MERFISSFGEHRLIYRAEVPKEQPKSESPDSPDQSSEEQWKKLRNQADELQNRLNELNKGERSAAVRNAIEKVEKLLNETEEGASELNEEAEKHIDDAFNVIREAEKDLDKTLNPINIKEHESSSPEFYNKVYTFDVPAGAVPFFNYYRTVNGETVTGHGYSLSANATSLDDKDVARFDRTVGKDGKEQYTIGTYNNFKGVLRVWINNQFFDIRSEGGNKFGSESVVNVDKKSIKRKKKEKAPEQEISPLDKAKNVIRSTFNQIQNALNIGDIDGAQKYVDDINNLDGESKLDAVNWLRNSLKDGGELADSKIFTSGNPDVKPHMLSVTDGDIVELKEVSEITESDLDDLENDFADNTSNEESEKMPLDRAKDYIKEMILKVADAIVRGEVDMAQEYISKLNTEIDPESKYDAMQWLEGALKKGGELQDAKRMQSDVLDTNPYTLSVVNSIAKLEEEATPEKKKIKVVLPPSTEEVANSKRALNELRTIKGLTAMTNISKSFEKSKGETPFTIDRDSNEIKFQTENETILMAKFDSNLSKWVVGLGTTFSNPENYVEPSKLNLTVNGDDRMSYIQVLNRLETVNNKVIN